MSTTDIVEVLADWPQPGTGNEGPRVQYGRGPFRVAYDTPSDRVAVIEFPLCQQFTFGHPNDEILHSHPLYERGLKHYSVHRIRNSSRLRAMERANAVHHHHEARNYLDGKEHFVITFQDGTLECLVITAGNGAPRVTVLPDWKEAYALFAATDF